MTDPPSRNDATLDDPLIRRNALCAEFEEAWQQAMRGGPEPDIASFLGTIPERERVTLRTELERIAENYSRHRAAANEQPQDEIDEVRRKTEGSMTLALAPDTK